MEKTVKPIIVAVDDNTAIQQLFKLATANLDVELRVYSSANEAMTYLTEHKPDLLFLDIIMPEKDGLTFLKELRHLPIHADTAVIMVSGKDYDQDKSIAKQLGAVDFLLKPTPARELQNLIAMHLSQ